MTGGEVAPGVTRLVLPLALPVGMHRIPTVNAYLLAEESGDTLVDCGIPVGPSRDPRGQRDGTEALEAALAGHGCAFERVSRVVVTHAHIDHFGLAGEVVRRSGADLWMHRETRLDVATYENPDDTVARRVHLLSDHGLHGERLTQAVRDLRDWMSALPSIGRATTVLEGGERFRAGRRTWEIVHRPGHSPGHVCLWSAADGVLCSGDHLLNPLSPPVAFDHGFDRDPMGSYLDSLRLVRELAPRSSCPGTGAPSRTVRDGRQPSRRRSGVVSTTSSPLPPPKR